MPLGGDFLKATCIYIAIKVNTVFLYLLGTNKVQGNLEPKTATNRSGFALRVLQLFPLCEHRRGATSVYISFNFMDWIGFNCRINSILCFLWQRVLHFLKSQVATVFSLRLLKFLLLLNLHYFIYDISIIVCLSLSCFS